MRAEPVRAELACVELVCVVRTVRSMSYGMRVTTRLQECYLYMAPAQSTLWHIQLLLHSTVQADYKYSLVVVLRHCDHCLVLVLEHLRTTQPAQPAVYHAESVHPPSSASRMSTALNHQSEQLLTSTCPSTCPATAV